MNLSKIKFLVEFDESWAINEQKDRKDWEGGLEKKMLKIAKRMIKEYIKTCKMLPMPNKEIIWLTEYESFYINRVMMYNGCNVFCEFELKLNK